MRKVIYWVHTSVDGFVDGPNGEFDRPVLGPELAAYSEKLDGPTSDAVRNRLKKLDVGDVEFRMYRSFSARALGLAAIRPLSLSFNLPAWFAGRSPAHARWGHRRALVAVREAGFTVNHHGRLRDECLKLHHFAMLLEAKVVIDDWRAEYNTVRPHSALGYQPPARYAAHCTHQHQQQEPELSKPLHK